MSRQGKIQEASMERAKRHELAEAELYGKTNTILYGYSRIMNSEICSFKAGAEWADKNKESWIDVDEELPYERSELVIDYNTFKITPWIFTHYPNDTFGITKMICEDGTWRWLSPGNVSIIKPDHWMPIPEIPKK